MTGGMLEQAGGYLRAGGFVMVPLAAAALLLWYALGFRLLTLRRGFRGSLRARVAQRSGGECAPANGLLDCAVDRGIALQAGRPRHLRRALDDAFFTLEGELRRFAVLARAIVTVAPLAGLLGTVAGMIETFDALSDMTLFSQSGGIAGGISQALISTQMGLAVAIPGLLVGSLLERRQQRLEDELVQLRDLLEATGGAAAGAGRAVGAVSREEHQEVRR